MLLFDARWHTVFYHQALIVASNPGVMSFSLLTNSNNNWADKNTGSTLLPFFTRVNNFLQSKSCTNFWMRWHFEKCSLTHREEGSANVMKRVELCLTYSPGTTKSECKNAHQLLIIKEIRRQMWFLKRSPQRNSKVPRNILLHEDWKRWHTFREVPNFV